MPSLGSLTLSPHRSRLSLDAGLASGLTLSLCLTRGGRCRAVGALCSRSRELGSRRRLTLRDCLSQLIEIDHNHQHAHVITSHPPHSRHRRQARHRPQRTAGLPHRGRSPQPTRHTTAHRLQATGTCRCGLWAGAWIEVYAPQAQATTVNQRALDTYELSAPHETVPERDTDPPASASSALVCRLSSASTLVAPSPHAETDSAKKGQGDLQSSFVGRGITHRRHRPPAPTPPPRGHLAPGRFGPKCRTHDTDQGSRSRAVGASFACSASTHRSPLQSRLAVTCASHPALLGVLGSRD